MMDDYSTLYPPQNPMGQFLNDPGMAMAGSAINNMMQMRRGMAPQSNPFQVLQEQQRRNAILQNQRYQQIEQKKLRDLQMQRMADPMYEFKSFVEQAGLKDAPYEDQLRGWSQFQLAGVKGSSVPSSLQELAALQQMDDGQKENFWRIKRGANIQMVNGVPHIYDAGSGTMRPFAWGAEATDAKVAAGQAEGMGQAASDTEVQGNQEVLDFQKEFNAKAPSLMDKAEDLALLSQLIDDPNTDLGPAAGRIGSIYNPNTGLINAMALDQIIATLAEVPTGALSEGELNLFRQKAADVNKGRDVNKAIVAEAQRLTERAVGWMRSKDRYIRDNKSLEGWGNFAIENGLGSDLSPEEEEELRRLQEEEKEGRI